jgi:hypothetical protein
LLNKPQPIYKFIGCLYGCETWYLTLREEHRLRMFKNRILFGPKAEDVTGRWGKLYS